MDAGSSGGTMTVEDREKSLQPSDVALGTDVTGADSGPPKAAGRTLKEAPCRTRYQPMAHPSDRTGSAITARQWSSSAAGWMTAPRTSRWASSWRPDSRSSTIGDSGDVQPYSVQREIEDLAAVIDAVGGQAHLFGASSGGALALVTQPVLLTIAATIDPHSTGLPVDSYGAAADAAAGHLPHARRATIDVPGHVADPATLAPVLTAFYTG